MSKIFRAIGLMSGTSFDGIDLSMIESDGKDCIKIIGNDYFRYDKEFRDKLRSIIFSDKVKLEDIKLIENELTILHANLVNNFIENKKISASKVDLIGFHGQTIYHNPAQKITWQIGNSQLLASLTKINVIGDFRVRDVVEGGQGAPLVPIYHYHLFSKIKKPCAILNIGGICNITFFNNSIKDLIAFDVCYGNAPMNDLIFKKLGHEFDQDGETARSGLLNMEIFNQVINSPIFGVNKPRSFSRNDFDDVLKPLSDLDLKDALATHVNIISEIIARDIEQKLPSIPNQIILCGGGAKNKFLFEMIQKRLSKCQIISAQEIGMNADFIEAEAFAFLAIRKKLNLPISFPMTTATKSADGSQGGVLFEY